MKIIELHRNKKKTINTIAIYTGVLLIMVAILLYSTGIISDVILIKGIVLSAFFILFICFFLFRAIIGLYDKSALITLQPEGITAKVIPVTKAIGLMKWTDIVKVEIKKLTGDTLVVIFLTNTEYYQSIIRKKRLSMVLDDLTNDEGYLMINLTASEIDCNAEELMEIINEYRNGL